MLDAKTVESFEKRRDVTLIDDAFGAIGLATQALEALSDPVYLAKHGSDAADECAEVVNNVWLLAHYVEVIKSRVSDGRWAPPLNYEGRRSPVMLRGREVPQELYSTYVLRLFDVEDESGTPLFELESKTPFTPLRKGDLIEGISGIGALAYYGPLSVLHCHSGFQVKGRSLTQVVTVLAEPIREEQL